MSILTDKEAKLAWANGEVVQWRQSFKKWNDLEPSNVLGLFDCNEMEFRLKPRTITINGIEVPAPFEPKAGERAFYIKAFGNYDSLVFDWQSNDFGYWRTEEEIRQVVAALRKCLEALNEHAR